MPSAGWINDPDPAKDAKLNILRKHDDRFVSTAQFQSAATQVGYNSSGPFGYCGNDACTVLQLPCLERAEQG